MPSEPSGTSSHDSTASEAVNDDIFACPICLATANYPVLTPCGHIYCYSCLQKWLTRSPVSNCAICRADISLSWGLTPVYAGRQEGVDPRPRAMFAKQKAAARANTFRDRLNLNIGGYDLYGNHQGGFVALRFRSPLDAAFNTLLEMIRNRLDRNANADADRGAEDPVEEPRRAHRNKIEVFISYFLYFLIITIWIMIHVYFSRTNILHRFVFDENNR